MIAAVSLQADGRQARPKAGEIRDALEQEIVTGTLSAGDRLDESALASRFGVSRTPVREAINQLASAALIEQIPNRGAFVRQVGLAELVEMFEVMAELEGMAGRLAARRADGKALESLNLAHAACAAAARSRDPDAYYYENERFHHLIYEACGNAFLTAEAKRLHQRLKAYRRLQLRVAQRTPQSLAEHERIVAAIGAGDGEAAERELRAHVTVQGERFADLVASLKVPER
ncbi:GntR family transcriptional regulator [Aurantimonas marianensis]|uniref:GntR family transcriptional regulator n=1 Tax=Aurantimonas marianensis TaxID=2920428 RepID=A0A9X2KFR6_9HYPH|nr:GntR family transcriptional regulator [Aurantimonas marianensis]MCP3055510.1 GntR family transcriptional regulator [Aurantimonas marianensis]